MLFLGFLAIPRQGLVSRSRKPHSSARNIIERSISKARLAAPGRSRLAASNHLATGFAVRRGIAYRRGADLAGLANGNPFQRWGTDIAVTEGGRELRLLSVHLKSGCWGSEQDRDRGREETCAVLRDQVSRLMDWADAQRAGGVAFVILGDFNRRLAVPGNWAWQMLSPPSAPLHLPTLSLMSGCDPRFKEFIDHLAVGGGAAEMLAPGSIREMPRHGRHHDHCALSAEFSLGGRPRDAGAKPSVE